MESAPLAYIVGINLLTFAIYAWDKSKARAKNYRVSENNLLFLALFGGWIGGLSACYFLRHKIRKLSFMVPLWGIAIAETAILLYSLTYGPPDFIIELMGQRA